jgi:hypothetical protein
MPTTADFDSAFNALRSILQPYARRMVVVADTDDNYHLDSARAIRNNKGIFFGAVRRGKAYVSFHLMPVYACPDLLRGMSPELKKRMQGKSCFNFKTGDGPLFKELAQLTQAGFARFKSQGYV